MTRSTILSACVFALGLPAFAAAQPATLRCTLAQNAIGSDHVACTKTLQQLDLTPDAIDEVGEVLFDNTQGGEDGRPRRLFVRWQLVGIGDVNLELYSIDAGENQPRLLGSVTSTIDLSPSRPHLYLNQTTEGVTFPIIVYCWTDSRRMLNGNECPDSMVHKVIRRP